MRALRTIRERPDVYRANYLGAFDATDGQRESIVFAPIGVFRHPKPGRTVREGLLRDADELEAGCLEFEDVVQLDDETPGLAFRPFAGDSLRDAVESGPRPFPEAVRFSLAACEALLAHPAYHGDFNLLVDSVGAWARVPELRRARSLERDQLTSEAQRWLVGFPGRRALLGQPIDERDASFYLAQVMQQLVTGERPGSVPFLTFADLNLVADDRADPLPTLDGPLKRLVLRGLAPRDERAGLMELHSELVLLRQSE